MLTDQIILDIARETINTESHAVGALTSQLSEGFVQAVRMVHEAKGRFIISGIGKSAIIAQKIVATLNSTGTPALFLHAADAIHGDLGMMQEDDITMLISKSGESPEIKVLVPFIQKAGNRLIALCGQADSFLAQSADCVIHCHVDKEACPNNLAPTSSTTAQLVMGDALAVCLLQLKGFTANDFARFHPGGALGKQLYLRVNDLCRMHEAPHVKTDSTIQQVILEITGKRLGATAVLNYEGQLQGVITDGDIRRMLENSASIHELRATNIMNVKPKTIQGDELAVNALLKMREFQVTQLVVLQGETYQGMIHMHDLLREGLV